MTGAGAGRRRAASVVALVLALFTVAAVAPAARADDQATRTAKRHFNKGEKLFALGRFDEALIQYEQAYQARPLPGFLFNIGQCHRNLGHYDQAIFSYRKYLREAPDADNRAAVESLIADLEERERAAQVEPLPPPVDVRHPPPARGRPLYKRWWFWTGVAVVAGAGTGTYLLLRDDGIPATDLGNVVFD